MRMGRLRTLEFCPTRDRFTRDHEQRRTLDHGSSMADSRQVETDEVNTAPLPGPRNGALDIEERSDLNRLVPDESLLAVDHRVVGEPAEEIGRNHEESCRGETGRCGLGPAIGIVSGHLDEIIDSIHRDPQGVRSKDLVYQLGGIHRKDTVVTDRTP